MYISGIASGLDTDKWIEAVMALERRPITQLQQRKTTLQQQRDAWRDINTRLNNLSSRLSDLRLSTTEVQHDVDRVIERVKAFVDQYNSVQNFIKEKTGDGGVLQGDVLLGRIQFQLRQLATARVDGAPK